MEKTIRLLRCLLCASPLCGSLVGTETFIYSGSHYISSIIIIIPQAFDNLRYD